MSKKGKGKAKQDSNKASESIVLAPGIATPAAPEVVAAPSTALEVAGGSVSTAQAAAVLAPKAKAIPYRHSAGNAPDNLLVTVGPTATKPGTVRNSIKELVAGAGKPVTVAWVLEQGGKLPMPRNWDQPRGKVAGMLAHGQLVAAGMAEPAPAPAEQPPADSK